MIESNALVQGIHYKRFGLKPEEAVYFTESPTHLILRNDYTPEELKNITTLLSSQNIDFYFTEVAAKAEVLTHETQERKFFGTLGPKTTKTRAQRSADGMTLLNLSEQTSPALRIRLPENLTTQNLLELLETNNLSTSALRTDFTTLTEAADKRYEGAQGWAQRQLESQPDRTAAVLYAGGDITHTVGVGSINSVKMHKGAGKGDIAFGTLAGLGTLGFFDQAAQKNTYSSSELYNLSMLDRLQSKHPELQRERGLSETLKHAWSKNSGDIGEAINALSGLGLIKSAADQRNPLTALQGGLVVTSWTGSLLLPKIRHYIEPMINSVFDRVKSVFKADENGSPTFFQSLIEKVENTTRYFLKNPRQLIKLNLYHNMIGITQSGYEVLRTPSAKAHLESEYQNDQKQPLHGDKYLGITLERQANGEMTIARKGNWWENDFDQNALLLSGLKTGYVAQDNATGKLRPLTEHEFDHARHHPATDGKPFVVSTPKGQTTVFSVEPKLSADEFAALSKSINEHQMYGRQVAAGTMRTAGYGQYLGANYSYSEAKELRFDVIDFYDVCSFSSRLLLAHYSELKQQNAPQPGKAISQLFDSIVQDIKTNYHALPLTEEHIRNQLTSALTKLQTLSDITQLADQKLGDLTKIVSPHTAAEATESQAIKQLASASVTQTAQELLGVIRAQATSGLAASL